MPHPTISDVEKLMRQSETEINRLRAINAELLAACKVALAALSAHDGYTGSQADACKQLRAAIAKAE